MKRNKILALIPAKAGSTRLPNKNVMKLGGRPLIDWAAQAAFECDFIDRVVISTDSMQYADIASECGIDVPFIRPPELGHDPYGVVDVALHALYALEEQGDFYDELIILLATSPLRTAADIRAAYQLFKVRNASFLMSVCAYDHPPQPAMRITKEGCLEPLFPEFIGLKSQEMETAYRANGALHILNVAAFKREKSYYAQPLVAYEMPRLRSLDIDTPEDFSYAQFLLAQQGDGVC